LKKCSDELGRPITILDAGGSARYWDNVPFRRDAEITVLNLTPSQSCHISASFLFHAETGDAADLSRFPDGAFDFYHSNSVIEHVGAWGRMKAMAVEARRVARRGWVQTPAWEFPIEPHLRTPVVHWFGQPLRRKLMRNPPWLADRSLGGRRAYVDSINLLSRREFRELFPWANIWTERFAGWPKSYVAQWSD
jgi:hypothetical protein